MIICGQLEVCFIYQFIRQREETLLEVLSSIEKVSIWNQWQNLLLILITYLLLSIT